MVKKIRTTLRISHAKLDDDIKSNIETALLDMKRLGIETFTRDKEGEIVLKDSQKELKDALVEKAVELYCKASFDFQGKGEQYQKSYEALRDSLSLSGEYKL